MRFAIVFTLAFAICGKANRDKVAAVSKGTSEDLEPSKTSLRSRAWRLAVLALSSAVTSADAFGVRPFQKDSNTAFAPILGNNPLDGTHDMLRPANANRANFAPNLATPQVFPHDIKLYANRQGEGPTPADVGAHASRLLSSEPAKTVEMARVGLKPSFARRLAQLIVFRERVGHADVPLGSSSGSGLDPAGLGQWVYAQRRRKAEGRIDQAEEAALDEIGFRWVLDAEELDWDEMLGRLAAWKAKTGDCLVPKKCEEDPLLGAWVAMCRRKADPLLNGGDKTAFPQEKRDALDAVGFCWEPANRCGSGFMIGLRAYGEAHMAGKPPPDEGWCKLQREARAKGKLSQQRIQYLDSFGFCWGDECPEPVLPAQATASTLGLAAAARSPGGSSRSSSAPVVAFRGPVQEHIEERVTSALKPSYLEATNESHGNLSDESHFHVLVVSEAFEGKRLIDRHRLVSGLFTGDDGSLKFHSLRITAKTPEQWADGVEVQCAPKCTGMGDGRSPTNPAKL